MTPPLNTYRDLSACVALVKQKCDISSTTLDTSIELVLEDSAGTLIISDVVEVIYRPYYVAAHIISSSGDFQNLKKAGSVEFTGMERAIANLLKYQNALDVRYALSIPFGMDASALVVEEEGSITVVEYPLLGSMSIPTVTS